MEKNVPTRKINGHTARKNPWITKSVKRNIAKAWRQYRAIPTEPRCMEYKRIRNETNKQVKADQANYRKKILTSSKGRPKKFYSYMQRLRTVKDKVAQLTMDNGTLSNTDQEPAQVLGKFFSSVFVKETVKKPEDMESVQDECENLNITIIDEEKVRNKLLQLQEDKAQGPDDIHPSLEIVQRQLRSHCP